MKLVNTSFLDECFIEEIASTFKEELSQSLSNEHIKAVRLALNEPTNENKEILNLYGG